MLNHFSHDDLAALRSDPDAGALGAAEDWAALAAHLGAHAGGTLPRQALGRAEFQLLILPALVRLASLTDNQQRKWDRILSVIQSVEQVHVQSPQVQGLIALGVSDGILAGDEAEAIDRAPCSRAEALLGRPLGPLLAEDLAAQWPAP